MKKYINAFLSLATVGILLYTINDQHKQIQHYKQEQVIVDSLREELFNAQSELGRYEMTLEILKDGEDKKAAQTFENVLTTQTE
jgi:hypothetical protein